MGKKRIRDFGIVPGRVKTGERNAITDVPGVRVGHCTVKRRKSYRCNRDRSWTGQCICQALYGSCIHS